MMGADVGQIIDVYRCNAGNRFGSVFRARRTIDGNAVLGLKAVRCSTDRNHV